MNTTTPAAITEELTDLPPVAAWSRRVRRIGGFIQAAFAALWLMRASLAIGGPAGDVLIAASAAAVIGTYAYAIRVTAGVAPRPSGPEARRIERSVTIATLSGPALGITTGIAAGVLLLGTALAGFRDLARIQAAGRQAA
jgi:hypothetical protein